MSASFHSINPATGKPVWQGKTSSHDEIVKAKERALQALASWKMLPFDARARYLQAFAEAVERNKQALATAISDEMGKPLWESLTEVQAMKNKVNISIQAYQERTHSNVQEVANHKLATRFQPYGLVAVLGPFNFPGHLPNGHIVPALLAGNVVLFKPSEHTPKVGMLTYNCWQEAKLPEGVLQILQGAREVAQAILDLPEVMGVYFTGSVQAGRAIEEASRKFPGRILALEMGGNNPLIVSHTKSVNAALYSIIQSAFLTSGQRCSCARRLIVIDESERIIDPLVTATNELVVGACTDRPEPFMGPVVSKEAAASLMKGYDELVKKGGKVLTPLTCTNETFLRPAIVDMTDANRVDCELFGPILQIVRVKNLNDAIREANNTQFGLTAGLISDSAEEYKEVYNRVKAGVINWNMPTTGASSLAPFGGLGYSGNGRPAGYFSADYCAYPVASQEAEHVSLPEKLLPGVTLP